jgi:predicted  nucleic acid-binding Zn-ribbon protein
MDFIADDIQQNDNETDKLRKLIAKFQDALAKQKKLERDLGDDLTFQQEELKDLHQESKDIANDLAVDRQKLLKLKVDNKKMLATLNEYDNGGEDFSSHIEEKKKEIQHKNDLISDLDAQIAKLEASLGNA